ncbi:MAG: EipA family protein [Hyphomonadaceae bacterium]
MTPNEKSTRRAVAIGLGAAAASALVPAAPALAQRNRGDGYTEDEIVNAVSRTFGLGAEAVASAVRPIFRDLGRPVGYVDGSEGSGAIGVGLRYGEGRLYMHGRSETTKVYWQGPSIGFDAGANAARVFTLVYGITEPRQIFRRFPGVEGSAYFIGGIGVNYQRAEGITLAPMRAGVGFRLGANIGYLAYSARRRILPF